MWHISDTAKLWVTKGKRGPHGLPCSMRHYAIWFVAILCVTTGEYMGQTTSNNEASLKKSSRKSKSQFCKVGEYMRHKGGREKTLYQACVLSIVSRRLVLTIWIYGPFQSLEQKIGLSNFGLPTQRIKSLIPPDWDQLGV